MHLLLQTHIDNKFWNRSIIIIMSNVKETTKGQQLGVLERLKRVSYSNTNLSTDISSSARTGGGIHIPVQTWEQQPGVQTRHRISSGPSVECSFRGNNFSSSNSTASSSNLATNNTATNTGAGRRVLPLPLSQKV